MVAQQLDQIIRVCEEYSNFQDSKPTFSISEVKIFPQMPLRQLNFGALSVKQLFYVYHKEKNLIFLYFNLQFLLLLNERGLSPAQQFFIQALVAYKPIAYKKTKCIADCYKRYMEEIYSYRWGWCYFSEEENQSLFSIH